MDRRSATTTAGAVTAVATAAVIAFGANFGIFGLSHQDSKVGKLPVVEAGTRSPIAQPPESVITAGDLPRSSVPDDDAAHETEDRGREDHDGDEDD